MGFIGRILGISLAQSVFQNMLKVNLGKYAQGLPEAYVEAVRNDAKAVWEVVPDVSKQ